MTPDTFTVGGSLAVTHLTAPTAPVLDARRFENQDRETMAQGFEELLMSMLVKEVRQSSGVQLFGDSPGSHLLESLFDQQFASALSENGGLGIGDRLAAHVMPQDVALEADDEETRSW